MSNQLAKMNRKQRREYAKNINTYSKLKGFESEFIKIEKEKAQKEIEYAKKHYLEIIMVMVALSHKILQNGINKLMLI